MSELIYPVPIDCPNHCKMGPPESPTQIGQTVMKVERTLQNTYLDKYLELIRVKIVDNRKMYRVTLTFPTLIECCTELSFNIVERSIAYWISVVD